MLGQAVRILREKKKLTQQDLADRVGVTRQAVCMWESDKRELKAGMLRILAKALNVTVGDIVKLAEEYHVIYNGKEDGMIKKGSTKKTVVFELLAPTAAQVFLTGDFNLWSETDMPMRRDRSGIWRASLNLRPGRYEYKFIVDGQWWTDPANNSTSSNTLGSLNSVREI